MFHCAYYSYTKWDSNCNDKLGFQYHLCFQHDQEVRLKTFFSIFFQKVFPVVQLYWAYNPNSSSIKEKTLNKYHHQQQPPYFKFMSILLIM